MTSLIGKMLPPPVSPRPAAASSSPSVVVTMIIVVEVMHCIRLLAPVQQNVSQLRPGFTLQR